LTDFRADWLAEQFEGSRPHLRAVAYRVLGSASGADDAVQEAWLRLSRTDTDAVDNLTSWLTTVVARVALDMLRSRNSRREDPLAAQPEAASGIDPADEAVLADSVGQAVLVVLETLAPHERLVFVLHDMFDMPFDEIAAIVGRTPAATRQIASRARRRVRGANPPDPKPLRAIVDAFLKASRDGDFAGLVALLDPDAKLTADPAFVKTGVPPELRGARAVASMFTGRAQGAEPATIDGIPGLVWAPRGRTLAVFAFEFKDQRVAAIRMIGDRAAIGRLAIELLTRRSGPGH